MRYYSLVPLLWSHAWEEFQANTSNDASSKLSFFISFKYSYLSVYLPIALCVHICYWQKPNCGPRCRPMPRPLVPYHDHRRRPAAALVIIGCYISIVFAATRRPGTYCRAWDASRWRHTCGVPTGGTCSSRMSNTVQYLDTKKPCRLIKTIKILELACPYACMQVGNNFPCAMVSSNMKETTAVLVDPKKAKPYFYFN